MSKLLDYMREGYANPHFQAVQEWRNPWGEMGVYTVAIEDELGCGTSYYHYIAILTNEGTFWHQQHGGALPIHILLEDAAILATFANAHEVHP